MAKVFVSLYNQYVNICNDLYKMAPFYEGFLRELESSGNEVLCYTGFNWGTSFEGVIPVKLRKILEDFSPDLCVFFNDNFWCVSDFLDCPIIIYDVDSVNFYREHSGFKKFKDHYSIVTMQLNEIDNIVEQTGISKKNVHFIPPFSAIKADYLVEKSSSVAFCGSNWMWQGVKNIQDFIKQTPSNSDRIKAKEVYEYFLNNPTINSEDIYNLLGYKDSVINSLNFTDLTTFSARLSGFKRILALDSISDLGLDLRGSYWDNGSMNYYPRVQLCYNSEQVLDLKDNQRFYNSAKIGFNINHIQAKSAFSWRVCDIMASSACLVSEYTKGFDIMFPGLKLPLFKNVYDVRKLVQYVLDNPNYREDVSKRSNEIIDLKYRPRNAIEMLEDIVNVSLSSKNKKGKLEFYFAEEVSNVPNAGETVYSVKFADKNNEHVRNYVRSTLYDQKKRSFISKKDFLNSLYDKGIYKRFKNLVGNNYENVPSSIELEELRRQEYNRVEWYMSIHRQNKVIVDSLRRELRTRKLVVAFMVIFDKVFQAEPVFNLMLESNIFSPIIVVIPDVHHDKNNTLNNLCTSYSKLKKKYGDKVYSSYDFENRKYIDISSMIDIVCSANPYDEITHEFYKINYLRVKKNILPFYINYGYPGVLFGRKVFSFQSCSLAWKYFIENQFVNQELIENEIIFGMNAVVVGYPLLDAFSSAIDKSKETRYKKTIMISPHHTIDYNALPLSNFLLLSEFFLELPKLYKDIRFIFRPHPLLYSALCKHKLWGEEKTKTYYQTMASYDNVEIDTEPNFIDSFMKCDGIIHDCSSFVAMWLFTGKPGCFVVSSNEKLEEIFMPFGQKMVKNYYVVNNKQGILNYINQVILNEKDVMKTKRIAFVDKHLKVNYGNSSRVIVDYLENQFIGDTNG